MQSDEATAAESALEEGSLIAGLRAGDARAYKWLVHLYAGRMMSVALRFTENREDAEDCVQDAFLQVVRNLKRFEERASIGTWLHRIVVNAALMKLRSRRRRPECSLEEMMPALENHVRSISSEGCTLEPAEEAVHQREVRNVVRRFLGELPTDYRDVLLLRDIGGYTTREAAALTDATPGAVKTRLHRARVAFKKLAELRGSDVTAIASD